MIMELPRQVEVHRKVSFITANDHRLSIFTCEHALSMPSMPTNHELLEIFRILIN